ncbi:LOW QUALITY PROTEIN: protease-associated domain-containing protein 1-like [Stegodyphus dumicola]|uniref:LOW QUALITY PROTEIN: protease-associated domain-containing protein 1-like n=1 Tax=Stegodyphus dumicola TaxID=202533 RepID=UPI0015AD1B6E|nr:LOW QUALITY PROTEIN: protease-associated domain-containing protein 1-like [Stegodyphus dumicola]
MISCRNDIIRNTNLQLRNAYIRNFFISNIFLYINFLAVIHGFEDVKGIKEDIYFEIVEPETLHYTFKVRPAQDFGVPFNDSLQNVGLVVAEPSHGCSAPINKLELRNNIALIDRGGCSFLSKCIQAERSGVLAVIICDNDISNDDQYIDMIDDSTKRNCSIPAVFLLGKDGYMIKKSLKTHNLTRAIINIPINMTYMPQQKQKPPPWVLW